MNLEDDLRAEKQLSAHWKQVAAYLLSCHAATLAGLPKRASKSERRRQTSICDNGAKFLLGTLSPPSYNMNDQAVQITIARAQRAAQGFPV